MRGLLLAMLFTACGAFEPDVGAPSPPIEVDAADEVVFARDIRPLMDRSSRVGAAD